MTTFKAALRVLVTHRKLIVIYLLIISLVGLGVSYGVVQALRSSLENTDTAFIANKPAVAVVDRDADGAHEVGRALEEYFDTHAEVKDVTDTESGIQDALMSSYVNAIIIVPQGYANALQEAVRQGDDISELDIAGTQSAAFATVNMQVEGFLGSVHSALIADPDTGIVSALQTVVDHSKASTVSVVKTKKEETPFNASSTAMVVVLNAMSYSIMVVMTLAITLVMSGFAQLERRRRVLTAPISPRGLGVQLWLACGVFAIVVWLWCTALSVGLTASVGEGLSALPLDSVAMALTSLMVLTICCMSFGFMLSQFGVSNKASDTIANTFGMASAFLSGAWLPQYMLPQGVALIAKLLPGWWYVSSIYRAFGGDAEGNFVSHPYTSQWASSVGLLALFAIGFLCVGLAVGRLRSRSTQ